jgi:cation:H+ antiporter
MWPFLIFFISALVLFKSSGWVIKYTIMIAKVLRLPTFAIGFMLLSVSTSVPELSVAVFSSLEGKPGLSLGDILGSNFVDLTLILSIVCLFGGTIYMKKEEIIDLIELLFITSLITIVIFQIGGLSISHGLILIVLFGFLAQKLYKSGKVDAKVFEHVEEKRWKIFAVFITSISLLLVSARFIVQSALQIAEMFSLTATFVGSTIVAFGTSLPELAVDLRAVRKKEYNLAIGDLFGSAVTNITLGLGILSIMSPGKIDLRSIAGLLPFVLTSILLVWYLFNKNEKITKRDTILLITLYILFLLSQAGIKIFNLFEFLP